MGMLVHRRPPCRQACRCTTVSAAGCRRRDSPYWRALAINGLICQDHMQAWHPLYCPTPSTICYEPRMALHASRHLSIGFPVAHKLLAPSQPSTPLYCSLAQAHACRHWGRVRVSSFCCDCEQMHLLPITRDIHHRLFCASLNAAGLQHPLQLGEDVGLYQLSCHDTFMISDSCTRSSDVSLVQCCLPACLTLPLRPYKCN